METPREPEAPPNEAAVGHLAPVGRLGEVLRRVRGHVRDALRDPGRLLSILLIAAFILRVIWLNLPAHVLIFDESYYVNAARIILGWPANAHYVGSPPGLDPNTEHPPLGKLLMAGSMLLFGDNGIGWRLPSVIAAMIALLATWAIVSRLHRSAWLALLVVALVAFDNLTLVHGRIGTLDILVLAPMLVAAWLALDRRWILAGVAMAVALLIKVTAIYGIGAILLYILLTDGRVWWQTRRIPLRAVRGPAAFLAITAVVGMAGLTALDARFTSFASPLDHLNRIVTYGANLQASPTTDGCPGPDSKPWQWIFNECQINYFREEVTVRAGQTVISRTATVAFIGAFNPLLAAAIPLASLFTLWYAWRTRSRLALWAVAWAAANYLPYVALALFTKRIEYFYYTLPLVPALAIGVVLLLTRAGLPRVVRWGYLLAYAAGFVAYFPFRQIP